MIYLLSEEGKKVLKSFSTQNTLFAFDYDGTLSEIVANPEAAKADKEIELELNRLSELAPTAVITGRGLEDIRSRLPLEKLHYVGNHGIEGVPLSAQQIENFKSFSAGWVDQLTQFFVAAERNDLLIEDKIYSLSVHYRDANDPQQAKALILEGMRSLKPLPRVIYGDHVINLVPAGAPHKGHALMDLVIKAKTEKVFFIGDDQTDEDVFGLNEPRLLSVKVRSPGPNVVPTHAKYYIHSQKEMLPLLRQIIENLQR